jgi:cell division protease FtsH
MLNEAAILAAREAKKEIDMKDLEEAATKVKLGPQKKRIQTEEDRKITAYHEGGHALVAYYMPHMDAVHKISIIGRGLSLGHTLIPPALDRVHETKTRLEEQLATMLGGRAAEELIFSEMTTGAGDDIEKATQLARAMITDYGMSSMGPLNLGEDKGRSYYEMTTLSEGTKEKVDEEIKSMMLTAYKTAQKVIKAHKDKLDLVAAALMEKETLEADEFDDIMKGVIKTVPAATKKSTAKKPSKAD